MHFSFTDLIKSYGDFYVCFHFIINFSQGPSAGFRSVLRTFVSAFVASYEINLQVIACRYIVILCMSSPIITSFFAAAGG